MNHDFGNSHLNEGTERTHERGKVPSLEQSGLELEWNGKESNNYIGEGEVGYKHICHGPHPS